MASRIELGDISIDVVYKDIKNVHLSVQPPMGRVRISAPPRMDLDTLRVYAIAKLPWIRRHQKKFQEQAREPQREYLERESHYLWGKRYLLSIIEVDAPPAVEFYHSRLILRVRPGALRTEREAILEGWYRRQLRKAVEPMAVKWEEAIGVHARQTFIQRMRTRWGSCNATRRNIRFNTELAKKPRQCLEYVLVHELTHLVEPTHNASFIALMDRFMPNWRDLRDELNSLPIGHADWSL